MARPPASPAHQNLSMKVLAPDELGVATALLAEAMLDNPLHVQAFGVDVPRRQRRLRRFLGQLLPHIRSHGELLGAWMHGELIGVLGVMKPGRCRPTRMELLRMARVIAVSNPPLGAWRIHRWFSAWARNDPREPHAHIGPLAILPAWRRQGVARNLMMRCCRRLDALGEVGWLETDLAINVAFYETLGFELVRREPVLGLSNWFMRRAGAGGRARFGGEL